MAYDESPYLPSSPFQFTLRAFVLKILLKPTSIFPNGVLAPVAIMYAIVSIIYPFSPSFLAP